jgi:hypothetical protein
LSTQHLEEHRLRERYFFDALTPRALAEFFANFDFAAEEQPPSLLKHRPRLEVFWGAGRVAAV